MSSHGNHIDRLTPGLVSKYLRGELSNEDMHSVEKLMLESDFEGEAMEGFESTSIDLEQDLAVLNRKLETRIRSEKTMFPGWFKVAAAVLLLALSTLLIVNWDLDPSPKQLTEKETISPQNKEETVAPEILTGESVDLARDSLIALDKAQELFSSDDADVSNSRTNSQGDEEAEVVVKDMEEDREKPAEEEPGRLIPPPSKPDPEALENEMVLEEQATGDVPAEMALAKKKEAVAAVAEEDKEVAAKGSRPFSIRGASSPRPPMRMIEGRVTTQGEETGMPGVNVILKGTVKGAVTDIDGNYNLAVPAIEGNVLVFSSLGFVSQEVTVPSGTTLDVELVPSITELAEVVVTAMGVEERRQSLGYSVSSVGEPKVIIPARPGIGKSAYRKYLQNNIRIPQGSLKGKVIVRFDVLPDGSLVNFEAEKGPGPDYTQEAIRLVKEGPKWSPAYKDSIAVRDKVRVKVRFK